MQLLLLLTALWMSDGGVSEIPCNTVAQCWLDDAGHAIRRPKKYAGRSLPRADCQGNLLWARYRLLCVQHRCESLFVGDMCLAH